MRDLPGFFLWRPMGLVHTIGLMPSGLHHITLNVRDLDRSRHFYRDVLGLEADQDFPGEKLRFRIPGTDTRLVLIPPMPGTPMDDRFSEFRIGLDHIAIGAGTRDELERLVETLRTNGVETRGVQHDRMGPALVSFRDPDNIQWEFFEQP
jgi:glyoxylase I family protein